MVPRPGAGPCGGMNAATEPTWTYLRRVPTPDAAPRCRPTPHTDQSCAPHLLFPCECFGLLRGLARVPAWDTPQVRPCRLWRGIHAAQGPTPARAQAPPVAIGYGRKSTAWLSGRGSDRVFSCHCKDQMLRRSQRHEAPTPQARWLPESSARRSALAILGAWCRVRGRDRVAAWMPPPSLHGRTCGVSRHRMRRRAANRLRTPTNPAHEICQCSVEASVYGGRLHAYRRGTRRKYVRVGSGAASMPLKVPHRYARKHHRLLSVAETKAKGSLRCTSSRASPLLTPYQQLACKPRMPIPNAHSPIPAAAATTPAAAARRA